MYTGNSIAIFLGSSTHWLFLLDLWPDVIFILERLLDYYKWCGIDRGKLGTWKPTRALCRSPWGRCAVGSESGKPSGGSRGDVWAEGPDTCIGNNTTRIHSEKPTGAGMSPERNPFLPPLKRPVPACTPALLLQFNTEDYFWPPLLCLCLIMHHSNERKIAAISKMLFRFPIPSPRDAGVKKRNEN